MSAVEILSRVRSAPGPGRFVVDDVPVEVVEIVREGGDRVYHCHMGTVPIELRFKEGEGAWP